MKHKKSESIWDATGSHTYYTVHKKKPIFKASSHTQPLLVIPEMAEGELRLHLKSLLSLACSEPHKLFKGPYSYSNNRNLILSPLADR